MTIAHVLHAAPLPSMNRPANTQCKNSFLLPGLLAVLALLLAGQLQAQTFKSLYTFTGGSDGAQPSGLVLSSNVLYGTAISGGSSSNGTIFALNTDGTEFRTLYSFTATATAMTIYDSNSDGAGPTGSLILSRCMGQPIWAAPRGVERCLPSIRTVRVL